MNEVKKSLFAGVAVAIAAGMVFVGSAARDRIDLGQRYADNSPLAGQTLLATRDNSQEVPEGDYFYEMSELLKREYVEPITDPQKLATGAVRGMVGSLGDPDSIYMDKDEFAIFQNQRNGLYEGIGADLDLDLAGGPKTKPGEKKSVHGVQPTGEDPQEAASYFPRVPKVTVVAIAPGGPADKAGVKVGDVAYSIDDHWVMNGPELQKFRLAQLAFGAKKLSLPELNVLRKDMRAKLERALMPLKAKNRLETGKSGGMTVIWLRNGQKVSTQLSRGTAQMSIASPKGYVLKFDSKAATGLKQAIAGKTEVTIDLRNNSQGDYSAMRECLAVVAPTGNYGVLQSDRKDKPEPLLVSKGNAHPPTITLVVDRSTRKVAEIFALALSSHFRAKIVGGPTGDDRVVQEVVPLPDGSGYTLNVGTYKTSATPTTVAVKGGSRIE